MNYEIYKIDDLTVRDLIEIKDILKIHLDFENIQYHSIINHIAFICLCKLNDEIIGIGAIKKNNNAEFKKNIFMMANRLEIENIYTNELGYLWTHKNYRNQGICSNIIKLLLGRYYNKNNGCIFATCKADNNNSISTLMKSNFEVSVSDYGITNFVNIKSGNVLKLMLHNKDIFLKRIEIEEKEKNIQQTIDFSKNI